MNKKKKQKKTNIIAFKYDEKWFDKIPKNMKDEFIYSIKEYINLQNKIKKCINNKKRISEDIDIREGFQCYYNLNERKNRYFDFEEVNHLFDVFEKYTSVKNFNYKTILEDLSKKSNGKYGDIEKVFASKIAHSLNPEEFPIMDNYSYGTLYQKNSLPICNKKEKKDKISYYNNIYDEYRENIKKFYNDNKEIKKSFTKFCKENNIKGCGSISENKIVDFVLWEQYKIDLKKEGFPPTLEPKNTKVLILGIFPGEKSLRTSKTNNKSHYYYADKNNCFWEIIFSLLGERNIPNTYEDKISILSKNNICLWDIIKSCERENSNNKNIKQAISNNVSKYKGIPIIVNGTSTLDDNQYKNPDSKLNRQLDGIKNKFYAFSTSGQNNKNDIKKSWRKAWKSANKQPQ